MLPKSISRRNFFCCFFFKICCFYRTTCFFVKLCCFLATKNFVAKKQIKKKFFLLLFFQNLLLLQNIKKKFFLLLFFQKLLLLQNILLFCQIRLLFSYKKFCCQKADQEEIFFVAFFSKFVAFTEQFF